MQLRLSSAGLGIARRLFGRQAPQHFLYFLPLPQGQGSFRPGLGACNPIVFRLRGCLKRPDSVIFHRLCFPIPASKQPGRTRANPGPRTVSLDLPGLFKHPLSGLALLQTIPELSCTRLGRESSRSGPIYLDGLQLRGACLERILDMGCGRGAILSMLAKVVPHGEPSD